MNGLFSASRSARASAAMNSPSYAKTCRRSPMSRRLCAQVLEEFQRSLSVHGRELRISVSVGASIYPDHAADAHALLRAADTALFRAKELGRNGWSLFVPQLLEAASSRFKVEQSLRRAVERGEFELLYQPEVCFETLETHTVEALLRWRQPDGNVVSPGRLLRCRRADRPDHRHQRLGAAHCDRGRGVLAERPVAARARRGQHFLAAVARRPLRRAPAGAARAALACRRSAWKSS